MIKNLKETFSILNKNFWLLFLFMTISYIGLIYFTVLRGSANSMPQLVIGLVTLLFIAIAGIAGFFHTLRSTIDVEISQDKSSRFELLKTFPKGVAEYFFPALGIIVLYLIITLGVFGIALEIGKNTIGLFSFTPDDFAKAMSSVENLAAFQQNLSDEDLIKLSKWHILYLAISSVLTFLLIYWFPEVFYKTKNSLLALFYAIKKVIFNPLVTLQLFLILAVINVLTSFIMAFLMLLPALTFIAFFLYFYSLLYILMLTFNVYRAKFVTVEPPQIVDEEEEELEQDEVNDDEPEAEE